MIRRSSSPNVPLIAKMLAGVSESGLKQLGANIKRLTNIKLKSILLRVIHGDVYCGTRLKKFGMLDTENCPRCGQPEDINHQIF